MKRLPQVDWESQPYGQVSDEEIASSLGVCREVVRRARVSRGIPSTVINWDLQPLGKVPDRALAFRLGVNPSTVHEARTRRNIPRGNQSYRTEEGETANLPEAILDLYWHAKGIPHQFQVTIGRYRADWVIHEKTVVEYAGFEDHKVAGPAYREKLIAKERFYREQGWKVLIIRPCDLPSYNLGVLPKVQDNLAWVNLIGTMPVKAIARMAHVSPSTVRQVRQSMGIKGAG